jgi:hypothetical protein
LAASFGSSGLAIGGSGFGLSVPGVCAEAAAGKAAIRTQRAKNFANI